MCTHDGTCNRASSSPTRPPSPLFPRRILAVYIIDMHYPRLVGAYSAAGQLSRGDLALIILYSKERVRNYPAVIYCVLMLPPSFLTPISGRCSPETMHPYSLTHIFDECCPGIVKENSLLTYLKDCSVVEVIHVDGFCQVYLGREACWRARIRAHIHVHA